MGGGGGVGQACLEVESEGVAETVCRQEEFLARAVGDSHEVPPVDDQPRAVAVRIDLTPRAMLSGISRDPKGTV